METIESPTASLPSASPRKGLQEVSASQCNSMLLFSPKNGATAASITPRKPRRLGPVQRDSLPGRLSLSGLPAYPTAVLAVDACLASPPQTQKALILETALPSPPKALVTSDEEKKEKAPTGPRMAVNGVVGVFLPTLTSPEAVALESPVTSPLVSFLASNTQNEMVVCEPHKVTAEEETKNISAVVIQQPLASESTEEWMRDGKDLGSEVKPKFQVETKGPSTSSEDVPVCSVGAADCQPMDVDDEDDHTRAKGLNAHESEEQKEVSEPVPLQMSPVQPVVAAIDILSQDLKPTESMQVDQVEMPKIDAVVIDAVEASAETYASASVGGCPDLVCMTISENAPLAETVDESTHSPKAKECEEEEESNETKEVVAKSSQPDLLSPAQLAIPPIPTPRVDNFIYDEESDLDEEQEQRKRKATKSTNRQVGLSIVLGAAPRKKVAINLAEFSPNSLTGKLREMVKDESLDSLTLDMLKHACRSLKIPMGSQRKAELLERVALAVSEEGCAAEKKTEEDLSIASPLEAGMMMDAEVSEREAERSESAPEIADNNVLTALQLEAPATHTEIATVEKDAEPHDLAMPQDTAPTVQRDEDPAPTQPIPVPSELTLASELPVAILTIETDSQENVCFPSSPARFLGTETFRSCLSSLPATPIQSATKSSRKRPRKTPAPKNQLNVEAASAPASASSTQASCTLFQGTDAEVLPKFKVLADFDLLSRLLLNELHEFCRRFKVSVPKSHSNKVGLEELVARHCGVEPRKANPVPEPVISSDETKPVDALDVPSQETMEEEKRNQPAIEEVDQPATKRQKIQPDQADGDGMSVVNGEISQARDVEVMMNDASGNTDMGGSLAMETKSESDEEKAVEVTEKNAADAGNESADVTMEDAEIVATQEVAKTLCFSQCV